MKEALQEKGLDWKGNCKKDELKQRIIDNRAVWVHCGSMSMLQLKSAVRLGLHLSAQPQRHLTVTRQE